MLPGPAVPEASCLFAWNSYGIYCTQQAGRVIIDLKLLPCFDCFPLDQTKPFCSRRHTKMPNEVGLFSSLSGAVSAAFLPAAEPSVLQRSVDLWIKGSIKSRAFLLRRRACFPSPSSTSLGLFYPEIPPPQY